MTIDNTKEFKYQGVILDSALSFESHIKMFKRKMVARVYTLRKIRWTLSHRDALTLFKGTILPYLDQGNPF